MKQIIKIVLILTALLTATVEAAYIKVDAAGNALPDSATSWSCVYDDVNELLWEVKTDDEGIHDRDNTYRWGLTATMRPAGNSIGNSYGDWDTLVNGTNSETLCGLSDWGVPSIDQLRDLMVTEQVRPKIDTAYFPNTGPEWQYWSSSPYTGYSVSAWLLVFSNGHAGPTLRTNYRSVRLVREGQLFLSEPQANFSLAPPNGQAPLTVTLDGSDSVAPTDGTIISYAWSSSDGKTTSGEAARLTFTDQGSYTITLTVTDGTQQTASSSQTITVSAPNVAPTASFTASPSSGKTPLTVTLDASGSSDADGRISSYAWSISNEQSASNSATSLAFDTWHPSPRTRAERAEGLSANRRGSFVFDSAGEYIISLTVTDDNGESASTSQTIAVTANQTPVASFSYTQSNDLGIGPLTVSVDALDSSDADGTIANYAWSVSDGQSASNSAASFVFDSAGEYIISLIVTDDNGLTATASETVTIRINETPIALFSLSETAGKAPLTVAVDGSGSSDGDGLIVSYEWETSDGQQYVGSTAMFTFDEAGAHNITLTIIDNEGATVSITETVNVSEFSYVTDIYNASSGILEIPSVSVDGSIYSVKMLHLGDLNFNVTEAQPCASNCQYLDDGDVYNPLSGILEIPSVSVSEEIYLVEMIHLGNLNFKVNNVQLCSGNCENKSIVDYYTDTYEFKWENENDDKTYTDLAFSLSSDGTGSLLAVRSYSFIDNSVGAYNPDRLHYTFVKRSYNFTWSVNDGKAIFNIGTGENWRTSSNHLEYLDNKDFSFDRYNDRVFLFSPNNVYGDKLQKTFFYMSGSSYPLSSGRSQNQYKFPERFPDNLVSGDSSDGNSTGNNDSSSSGSYCASGTDQPYGEVQIDTQCQTACYYLGVGNTAGAQTSCGILEQYESFMNMRASSCGACR